MGDIREGAAKARDIGPVTREYDRMWARAASVALLALAVNRQQALEIRGRIEPAPARAVVAIYGAYTPFTATVLVGPDGRFRFKRLAPGSYTVEVLSPGQGEVRRTLDVTPSRADRKGRVELRIPFRPAARTAQQTGAVSLRRLSIPRRALDEYDQARQRLSRYDTDGAVQCLRRAVELAPAYAEAWNYLGTIAYQTQRYVDAESYFRRALEADSVAYSPTVNLGGVLINLGRPGEALEYNRHAVEERPEDALGHSQLGMSYLLTGDEEHAVKHLKLSKSLDPAHFSKPQLLLAGIYARRGQQDNAVAELEDFVAQHPDAPECARIRDQIVQLRRR